MAVSFCPFIPVQLIGAVGAVIGFQLARQARREDYRRELACSIGTVASIAGVVLCLLTPACPNEVNGRETPITTRGIVAMQGGGFGYELDLLKLPERACEHIRNQVKRYHEVEDLVREGLFFRLSSPLTDAVCAWEYVAEDGSRAVVSAVLLSVNGYGVANYVVPRGLTPGALYRNLDTGVVYPADALMDAGFPLPVGLDANAAVMYRFERVDV